METILISLLVIYLVCVGILWVIGAMLGVYMFSVVMLSSSGNYHQLYYLLLVALGLAIANILPNWNQYAHQSYIKEQKKLDRDWRTAGWLSKLFFSRRTLPYVKKLALYDNATTVLTIRTINVALLTFILIVLLKYFRWAFLNIWVLSFVVLIAAGLYILKLLGRFNFYELALAVILPALCVVFSMYLFRQMYYVDDYYLKNVKQQCSKEVPLSSVSGLNTETLTAISDQDTIVMPDKFCLISGNTYEFIVRPVRDKYFSHSPINIKGTPSDLNQLVQEIQFVNNYNISRIHSYGFSYTKGFWGGVVSFFKGLLNIIIHPIEFVKSIWQLISSLMFDSGTIRNIPDSVKKLVEEHEDNLTRMIAANNGIDMGHIFLPETHGALKGLKTSYLLGEITFEVGAIVVPSVASKTFKAERVVVNAGKFSETVSAAKTVSGIRIAEEASLASKAKLVNGAEAVNLIKKAQTTGKAGELTTDVSRAQRGFRAADEVALAEKNVSRTKAVEDVANTKKTVDKTSEVERVANYASDRAAAQGAKGAGKYSHLDSALENYANSQGGSLAKAGKSGVSEADYYISKPNRGREAVEAKNFAEASKSTGSWWSYWKETLKKKYATEALTKLSSRGKGWVAAIDGQLRAYTEGGKAGHLVVEGAGAATDASKGLKMVDDIREALEFLVKEKRIISFVPRPLVVGRDGNLIVQIIYH